MIKINIYKKLHLPQGNGELRIDTEISSQSFTALYGPSGAGKTSLLRIIAGLLKPERGIIEVNGQTWLNTDRKINLPPQKRNIGFVFQDYALFPNMTVEENLRYALPTHQSPARVQELMAIMNLQAWGNLKPDVLSGGQKQRVALARALVREPEVLLLDEPLSALDDATRLQLQQELLKVHQQYNLTTLLVSHHLPEIYKLATHVIKIEHGQLLQSGSAAQVFGWQLESDNLYLTGEVVGIETEALKILVQQRLVGVKHSSQTKNLKVGDKVSLQATDLLLHKLS
ncbi:ATP-binding cassette domain-containing protein [Mucilaginibacter sp. CSA2-8R]|uniref:sulfate/molybdate ABC transporter ATP-binding protein n=1 Tax=Mucilaginibacter sp. CSA2-8R TaxID=3141542 RepID=UPI00315C92AC